MVRGVTMLAILPQRFEDTAALAENFLRRHVPDGTPSQIAEPLGKEGDAHDQNHDHIRIDIICQDNRGGEKQPADDGQLAGIGQAPAPLEQPIGPVTTEKAADKPRKSRNSGKKAGFQEGHSPRVIEICRKPGEEEPRDRGESELADIDT